MEEIWPSPVARRLTMKRSSPSASPPWSGCGHDGGIEKRRRLQGIFPGEKRADVELAGLGKPPAAENVRLNLLEVLPPDALDIHMPAAEVRDHRGQFLLGLALAQGEGAPDDVDDTGRIARDKGANQDP